jgi:hypothetical protein
LEDKAAGFIEPANLERGFTYVEFSREPRRAQAWQNPRQTCTPTAAPRADLPVRHLSFHRQSAGLAAPTLGTSEA